MFWKKQTPTTMVWSQPVDARLAKQEKLTADLEGHVASLERRQRTLEYREKAQDLLAPHIAGSTMVAQQLQERIAELLEAVKRLT